MLKNDSCVSRHTCINESQITEFAIKFCHLRMLTEQWLTFGIVSCLGYLIWIALWILVIFPTQHIVWSNLKHCLTFTEAINLSVILRERKWHWQIGKMALRQYVNRIFWRCFKLSTVRTHQSLCHPHPLPLSLVSVLTSFSHFFTDHCYVVVTDADWQLFSNSVLVIIAIIPRQIRRFVDSEY